MGIRDGTIEKSSIFHAFALQSGREEHWIRKTL